MENCIGTHLDRISKNCSEAYHLEDLKTQERYCLEISLGELVDFKGFENSKVPKDV